MVFIHFALNEIHSLNNMVNFYQIFKYLFYGEELYKLLAFSLIL